MEVAGAAAEVKSKSNFESLPNEVLQLVWAHLEDPASWAQICTRFEQLSRDTLWRSRWFMQRYAPYLVIYEAIARPKLFTPSLLEHLIRLGAPISRNLVQLLYLMHNPLSTYISNRERFKWGKVTSTAYVAIMQHAIALYGEKLELKELDLFDSSVFSAWIDVQHDADEPQPSTQVRELFEQGRFMPLPLHFWTSEEDGPHVRQMGEDLSVAIVFDSRLASAALNNGWEMHTPEVDSIMTRWDGHFLYREAEKFVDKTTTFIKALQVDGVLPISEELARSTFAGRRETVRFSLSREGTSEFRQWMGQWMELDNAKCAFLLSLDKDSALPFKLIDVVSDLLDASELESLRIAVQGA